MQKNQAVTLAHLIIFNLNDDNSLVDPDLNCLFKSIRCKNYSPIRFNQQFKPDESALSKLSLFHTNIRSERSNLEDFQCHILLELDFHFNIIAVTETRIYNEILNFNPNIPNYNFEFVPTPLPFCWWCWNVHRCNNELYGY